MLSTNNALEMFKKFGFSEESIFSSTFKKVQLFERTDLRDPLQGLLYYMKKVDVKYGSLVETTI